MTTISLRSSILNSDLEFLNAFVNLEELDLSSVSGIKLSNQTLFEKLTQLRISKLANLNITNSVMSKHIKLELFQKLTHLDLSGKSLERFFYYIKNFNYL